MFAEGNLLLNIENGKKLEKKKEVTDLENKLKIEEINKELSVH